MRQTENGYEYLIMRSDTLRAAYMNIPGLVENHIGSAHPIDDGVSLFFQSIIKLTGYKETKELTDNQDLMPHLFDVDGNAPKSQMGERLFSSLTTLANAYESTDIKANSVRANKDLLAFFTVGLFLVMAHAVLTRRENETIH
ncbi:hypothetical protein AVO42_11020 [Thiomicrospira sp. XS5]|uniref:hypothetical protein n=1 Tax=Thiomicrospira sp. XS5 TaxID=1775636 RepID=UPI0007497ADD|nr:hypothetical protein [Thiomicrospira sp. XS5]KUJ75803.1 hypothetical protein AVO42_11020 [Thiomicrospira sp. XS5]